MPFRHNDVDSFRDILASVLDSHLIKQGSRSIIVSVESVHSMDGDLCPIQEFLEVSKEICPKGSGLVSSLGNQNEIAIRLHTCGKGMASPGGKILPIVHVCTLVLARVI